MVAALEVMSYDCLSWLRLKMKSRILKRSSAPYVSQMILTN